MIVHLECILLDRQQGLQPDVVRGSVVKRHHRLPEPKEKPSLLFGVLHRRADADRTRLFVHGEVTHQNTENIDATASLLNEVTVFDGHHAFAPSDSGFANPPLEGCGCGSRCPAIWECLSVRPRWAPNQRP